MHYDSSSSVATKVTGQDSLVSGSHFFKRFSGLLAEYDSESSTGCISLISPCS